VKTTENVIEIPPVPVKSDGVSTVSAQTETAEGYIRRVFPLHKTEQQMDVRVVGDNRYRTLYWKEAESECFIPDYKINRSYYIALKKDGFSWSHEVFKD